MPNTESKTNLIFHNTEGICGNLVLNMFLDFFFFFDLYSFSYF